MGDKLGWDEGYTIHSMVDILACTPDRSWVYFMLRSDDRIKIGYSLDVFRRKRDLEAAAGPLVLLAAIPGGPDLEHRLHVRFDADRVHGEWFDQSPELLGFLDELSTWPSDVYTLRMPRLKTNNPPQPEGSHVHWPSEISDASDGSEISRDLHWMSGDDGPSSSWGVRLPNDEFVDDYGVTLEEMRKRGAV